PRAPRSASRRQTKARARLGGEPGLTNTTLMVRAWRRPIGLGFAPRRPELITRLIIGNTWAWPLDREPRVRAFSWLMGGPIGRTLTRGFNFVPRFFFRRGFAQPVTGEVRDLYLAPWRDPHRRAPAVIAPRQLIAASQYAREVQAGLPTLP